MEQILLAVENIYAKCKEKKDWTQHEIYKKEFINKKGYDKRGNIIKSYSYLKINILVAQAKQMIKNINYYIADYETILESYRNEKNK